MHQRIRACIHTRNSDRRADVYTCTNEHECIHRFVDEDEEQNDQLQRMKESIRLLPSSLTTTDYRAPQAAARQARLDLITYVNKTFPSLGTGWERRRERLAHTAFALHRRLPWDEEARGHRAMELDLLDAFINPRSQTLVPLVVAGAAGVGKTALLVNLVAVSRGKLPHALWHIYMAGSAPGARDYQKVCVGLQQALKARFSLDMPVRKDLGPSRMSLHLSQWLAAACGRGLAVIIIDGLDQIEDGYDGGAALQWLPHKFPAKLRVILSVRSSGPAFDEVVRRSRYAQNVSMYAHRHRHTQTDTHTHTHTLSLSHTDTHACISTAYH